MREFELLAQDARVSGPVIETFLVALGPYRSRGAKVVARACGEETIDTSAGRTYQLRGYLSALDEFQRQFGQDFMHKVGALIFDTAIFPPGIDGIEKALELVDTAYRMNITNGEDGIGSYRWTMLGDRSGTMACDNPFPCSFDLGIVKSIARRFEPNARVEHTGNSCRHRGGTTCTYAVEW